MVSGFYYETQQQVRFGAVFPSTTLKILHILIDKSGRCSNNDFGYTNVLDDVATNENDQKKSFDRSDE